MKLHGLRHSHISLLFSMNFNVLEIARRTGHKEQTVTYMYAELIDAKEKEMASRLDDVRKGGELKCLSMDMEKEMEGYVKIPYVLE